jgi:hypothetical protein
MQIFPNVFQCSALGFWGHFKACSAIHRYIGISITSRVVTSFHDCCILTASGKNSPLQFSCKTAVGRLTIHRKKEREKERREEREGGREGG